MTELYMRILYAKTETRGVTLGLERDIRRAIQYLDDDRAGALWRDFSALHNLLHLPTREQCIDQMRLLQQERAELRPLVDDKWPEHRDERITAILTDIQVTLRHFARKLGEIRMGAAA